MDSDQALTGSVKEPRPPAEWLEDLELLDHEEDPEFALPPEAYEGDMGCGLRIRRHGAPSERRRGPRTRP